MTIDTLRVGAHTEGESIVICLTFPDGDYFVRLTLEQATQLATRLRFLAVQIRLLNGGAV